MPELIRIVAGELLDVWTCIVFAEESSRNSAYFSRVRDLAREFQGALATDH
jgi:hypothetical protein